MNPAPIKELATIDDLAKLDIRVGTIEAVGDVEGSKKLVQLTVNFGDHNRTILAGMKQEREDPAEITGKQALFVVNLAPIVVVMMAVFLVLAWLVFGRGLKVDEERRQHILTMREDRLIKDPTLVKKSVFVLGLTTVGFALHGALHFEPATVALAGAACTHGLRSRTE